MGLSWGVTRQLRAIATCKHVIVHILFAKAMMGQSAALSTRG